MPNVLIVDDNQNYRQAFTRNLLLEGYEVFEAEDSDEALEYLEREAADTSGPITKTSSADNHDFGCGDL